MKKAYKPLSIALMVLGLIYAFLWIYLNQKFKTKEVCFNTNCFTIEIADTKGERQKGLMYVEKMSLDRGMLFIFPDEGEHTFWTKNTLIPLDIIWISSDLEIVDIQHAIPCEKEDCDIYTPKQKSKYILEINGGLSEELGIEVGDSINFEL